MNLADVGERRLVARLVAQLATDAGGDLGDLRDDAAVLSLGGTHVVASTDTLSAATHFPKVATPADMGWMVGAVNLSDVAAMGADPLGLLVAVGAPPDLDVAVLDGIAAGLAEVTRASGCSVLGGDTKENPTLTLTGTALGVTPRPLYRRGGRPGDVLAVTGPLGGAAVALAALEGGADREAALALLRPVPRLAEGIALREAGATAAMDVSDGLGVTVHALAAASGGGAVLDVAKVPRPSGATDEQVLGGGGDYQLVATLPPAAVPDAEAAVPGLVVVGALTASPGVVTPSGEPVAPLGWQHFSRVTADGRKDNP